MFQVIKSDQFMRDLEAVVLHIAQDNVAAALSLEARVHQQVDSLADPNFPRRRGRKAGTMELVVHPHYIVVIQQTQTSVLALNVLHVARQYP